MKSHTVPRFLLDQFAYYDPVTKSRRLWQYAKGRPPTGFASPRSATRIDGHFNDPADAQREAIFETRLNDEFENPVHQFIPLFRFPQTFTPSRLQIRQLTRYLTLLWHRSQNRRKATKEQIADCIDLTRQFIADEEKLQKIAAHWTMKILALGVALEQPVSAADVRESAEKMIAIMQSEGHQQTAYMNTMERVMATTERVLEDGEWSTIQTTVDRPFVISDAPVVSWQRHENGVLEYGRGFHTSDVEVTLPITSTECIWVLPNVQRNRRPRQPLILEINHAQAAFATNYCYAHKCDPMIDRVLQSVFSQRQIGVNAFTVKHRNYNDTMFEILMSGGSSFRRR